MAEYGKLLSRIWSDPEFVGLDARPQQVYCMLISYSTRNLAGVLPLTLKRWAKSTRDGSVANVSEALAELETARFVVVDWDTEEVLIRTYIRNDEVYRQPNLMKSARKSALQTESESLRWALHDELSRIVDPKAPEVNSECALLLVRGLSRTLPETLPGTLREPLPEPPGVGVGYVLEENTSTFHLSPSPAPAPDPPGAPAAATVPDRDEPSERERDEERGQERGRSDPVHHSASRLVSTLVPANTPAAVKTGLRLAASQLLVADGLPSEVVAESLRRWCSRPDAGPGLLPHIASTVLREGTAPKPSSKLRDWAEFADSIPEDQQHQQPSRKAIEQ